MFPKSESEVCLKCTQGQEGCLASMKSWAQSLLLPKGGREYKLLSG